jgi:photosystem II stability/assembly factor-like uncharacterized protein
VSERILAATRKGLFVIERTAGPGSAWDIARTAFLGDNLSYACADPRDQAWYAALDHGHFGVKLQRSDDQGETWHELGAPVYPAKPADWDEAPAEMRDRPMPWKLLKIWSFASGGADRPGRLWAGTIPGGLFRSDDRGATWSLVESLWFNEKRKEWFGGGADWPGIHSVLVDPRNSDRVLIGVSCGGAWLTEDAGATWQLRADGMRADFMPPDRAYDPNIQDPHCIVRCPGAPDTLWCQHHNGVFKTVDEGRNWTDIPEVNPSVFGFAVAVHPQNPDTAWFVPAVKDEKRIPVDGKVVVARTRDGGKTFDILREGLPQRHAYDITFRHGLDVDASGNCLAFGSTTGSLWVSDDQGDSWQTVSRNLPPVYSVRFG